MVSTLRTWRACGRLARDGFIGQDLVAGVKSGYNVTMAGAAGRGAPASNGWRLARQAYTATGTPIAGAGNRSFVTNQAGTIWQDNEGNAFTVVPTTDTPGDAVGPIQ